MKTKDGKVILETSSELDAHFKAIIESNPFSTDRGRSEFDVPPEIVKAVEAKGMELRWIDSREYEKNGNQHKNYWVPYRHVLADAKDLQAGVSADGYVRRKGLVLAIRPKQLGDKHRAMIKQKTLNQARVAAASQEAYREEARRAGFKTEDID